MQFGARSTMLARSTVTTDPLGVGAKFFDHFAGVDVDQSKWYVVHRKSDAVNGEQNACIPSACTVASSILSITANYVPGGVTTGDRDVNPPHNFVESLTYYYTSGHIMQKTAPQTFGVIDYRAKVPAGSGVWPCMWMLGENWQASQPYTADVAGHNWPVDGWCEVDVSEFFTGNRDVYNGTAHYQTAGSLVNLSVPFNATTRFMVYRLEWRTDKLEWSVDAEDGNGFVVKRTITGSSNVPQVPMFIVVNMAVGGSGGGTIVNGDFPMTMNLDYIRWMP